MSSSAMLQRPVHFTNVIRYAYRHPPSIDA